MAVLGNVEEFHEESVEFSSIIGEMGGVDTRPDLKIPDDWMQRISDDDDKPMFVIVDVESGWSKSKLKWPGEHVEKAAKVVNERRPGGNLGHPLLKDKKAYETEFPEPQVVWLAATSKRVGDKVIATFKGYVLKNAPARQYLKLGLIDGVSMFGDSTLRPISGGYEVKDFDLETIDFARKGRSGMKSRVLSLTGEQASEGGQVDAKDIAALDENELRTHNALLVREIERKAVEPVETKIGEQQTTIDTLDPKAKLFDEIKALLKLSEGENPIEKLTNLLKDVEEVGIAPVKSFLKELLEKKIKDPTQQRLVARLVGEMHTEYVGKELDDDLKKQIEDDFTDRLEKDEDIKAVIGEMSPARETAGGNGGASLGGRSSRGEERTEQKSDVRINNERLTVRKTTLT